MSLVAFATDLKTRISENRRRRKTVEMLANLSDAQLADIGIRRFDIPRVVHEASSRRAASGYEAPARAPALSYAG